MVLTGVRIEEALNVVEDIRRRFETTSLVIGQDAVLNLTVSIGVAGRDGQADSQCLIKRADAALNEAKRAGRKRCCLAQAEA